MNTSTSEEDSKFQFFSMPNIEPTTKHESQYSILIQKISHLSRRTSSTFNLADLNEFHTKTIDENSEQKSEKKIISLIRTWIEISEISTFDPSKKNFIDSISHKWNSTKATKTMKSFRAKIVNFMKLSRVVFGLMFCWQDFAQLTLLILSEIITHYSL